MSVKRILGKTEKSSTVKKRKIVNCSGDSLSAASAVERIIDANLNRCREGLRVVEDSLRFVLNDEVLYKKIRAIRHETDKVLRDEYGVLISMRDTFTDSGRQMPETVKKKLSGIMIANFKRAQESLRVLEEYSKTVFPLKSALFKKQRYNAYNAEKTVFLKYGKIFE